jgi:hypothetical protein
MRTSNRVASLEVAKAEFEAAWKQWKAWAEMEELPLRESAARRF